MSTWWCSSGDVYDRALPPVDAVELADDAFARLAASRAAVVVSSGNHDSAARLGFNSRLADAAGVHLRTRWQDVGTPVLLGDEHGPVAVHAIPYLEPDAVRAAWQLPERSHEAALTSAMARVTADLAERPGTRSVVLAHAFVAGSPEAAGRMSSASERDISVGGIQIAPTRLFTGVDYAALGHLHGRQTLTDTVRYSGSPLAYSFSEAGQPKGSWLVDLGRQAMTSAEFVAAPVPRRLATVRGRLEDLLAAPEHAGVEDAWLQVTLTDPRRPAARHGAAARPVPAHADADVRPGGGRAVPWPRAAARRRAQRPRHRARLRRRGASARGHHRGGAAAPARVRLVPDQRRPGRRLPRGAAFDAEALG